MIEIICGLMNSGKTLVMTKRLIDDYLHRRNILTNYSLFFPKINGGKKILKINKDYLFMLGEKGIVLEDCSIGLDELWIWADSRKSQSNTMVTYFFNQSSKDDTSIYITVQHNRQNDIRIRDNCHKITLCSRVIRINDRFKDINEEKRFLPNKYLPFIYIKAQQYKRNPFGLFIPSKLEFIRVITYMKYYNTKEKVKQTGENANE